MKNTVYCYFQIEDLQGQIKYLNESMGNMKVDHDLQLEKFKKERDHDGSSHLAEVDKKDATINKLKWVHHNAFVVY